MNERHPSSPPSSPRRDDVTSPTSRDTATTTDVEEANNSNVRIGTPSSSASRTPVHHDDDDMTEINIDDADQMGGSNFVSRLERIHGRNTNGGTSRFFWSEEEERAYEIQRREQLNQELLRIQKRNFIQFTILCMVPLFLLVLVVVSSLTSNQSCNGYEIATCAYEERSFLNAFTRRCICKGFAMK